MEKKQEAIVLLNEGEKSNQEEHCNSWPKVDYPYLRPTGCFD